MRKKIILIWKFDQDYCNLPSRFSWEINEDGVCYIPSIAVGASENSICPIILKKKVTKDIFENTLKLAKNILDKENGENNVTLILLHNTKIDDKTILDDNDKLNEALDKNTRETLRNDNYEIFKGTSGGVIYNLITDEASFGENVFENSAIKKDIFDNIWKEYYVKKKIIRLKFDCLSKCLPIVIDMKGLKECADGGDSTKTSEYLSIIQVNKNWILPPIISLDERNCPSEELREEINQAIENISSLGKKIEGPSTTPQDVVNIMDSEQFNIDDWYSNLEKSFERYTKMPKEGYY